MSPPFETKRAALRSLGVERATHVSPGVYAVGDAVITTEPGEAA